MRIAEERILELLSQDLSKAGDERVLSAPGDLPGGSDFC